MRSSDLQWHLESWLQCRYGPRAVLSSRPSEAPARITLSELVPFLWLEVTAPSTDAPRAVGIRRLPDDARSYELLEWFGDDTTKLSHWRLDIFNEWHRAIDL